MVDFSEPNGFEWFLAVDDDPYTNPPDIPHRGAIVTPQKLDLVSTPEIAERLNVKPMTVHVWRQRDLNFPAPDWSLGVGPVWKWATVEKWATKTGRIQAG